MREKRPRTGARKIGHAAKPGDEAKTGANRPSRGLAEPKATRLAIGARVSALRKDAGLTQVALGAALGKPQSWVAKIETGRRSLLLSEAIEVTDTCGVALDRLKPSGIDEIAE
jgi:ribosome-binding protein aMBF1 (putative translation factor)